MKSNFAEVIEKSINNAIKKLHGNKRGTCQVDGCINDSIAKGFCNAHYIRKRRGKDLTKPTQLKSEVCIDCGIKINAKGAWMRCSKHFKLARQKTIKEAIVDAMGGCCQNCKGIFNLCVYDFHHIGEKDENPSRLIANGNIEKIAKEMEKCILLCANCHRVEHETEL